MAQRKDALLMAVARQGEQANRAAMTIKDIWQTIHLAALIAFAMWGFVG